MRRASGTDCLHLMEGERIVRCTRGQLLVRDREKLETLAGENYGPAEASYRALIAPFGKVPASPRSEAHQLASPEDIPGGCGMRSAVRGF